MSQVTKNRIEMFTEFDEICDYFMINLGDEMRREFKSDMFFSIFQVFIKNVDKSMPSQKWAVAR